MGFKKNIKYYVLVLLGVLFILGVPKALSTTLRGGAFQFFEPLIQSVRYVKHKFSDENDKQHLQEMAIDLENSLLKSEIARLQELLFQEIVLASNLAELGVLQGSIDKHNFAQRRFEELQRNVDLKINAVPATIIYRGSSAWHHTCFIDVGHLTNKELGREVVQKNSPVTYGSTLIGIVEEVYEKKSLVRLISDPSLHPSVRVSRGYQQNMDLVQKIDSLILALKVREGLLANPQDHYTLIDNLEILKKSIEGSQDGVLLAKGEMMGAIYAYKMNDELILKGSGFNYDIADSEGPSRDLRSGKPYYSKLPAMPLIAVGDLLVTTGMDGVFPEGLSVAEVLSIDILKEGAYSYDITAKSTAKSLDQIKYLFVMPPIGG